MAQPKPIFARIENRVEEEDGGEAAKKVVKNKDKVPQAQGVAEA
jgi:methionyl-tRNA synthetase